MTLITIKKRSEFIRSNKFSKKIYTPNFIIQKLESNENDNIPHFGFTITNYLPLRFDKPNITTLVYIKMKPLTKLQSVMEKINVTSSMSILFYPYNFIIITLIFSINC